MSRHIINNVKGEDLPRLEGVPMTGTFNIATGFDHAIGYFVQFYPLDNEGRIQIQMLGDDPNDPAGLDSLFTGLTGTQLGAILQSAGRQDFADCCFWDLSF